MSGAIDIGKQKTGVERQSLSVNQFAELLGFEPERFIGVQVNKQSQTIWLLLEPEEKEHANDRNDATTRE